MVEIDWFAWHRLYDNPTSKRAARLARTQDVVLRALREQGPGRIRVVSLCAGQARELVGALARYDRPADVDALLVELDPRNAAHADRATRDAGAGRVRTVVGDAGLGQQYRGLDPVDILLLCGVFGNLTLPDIERTVDLAGAVLRPGGTVIWTRHRGTPDRVATIQDWFAARGFVESYANGPEEPVAIVAHRMARGRTALPPGDRIFTFVVGATADAP